MGSFLPLVEDRYLFTDCVSSNSEVFDIDRSYALEQEKTENKGGRAAARPPLFSVHFHELRKS